MKLKIGHYIQLAVIAILVTVMIVANSILLEPTLAISDADFVAYYDALVQFWDQLPERMYTSD